MDTETKTNLKIALGLVGLCAIWFDPASLTWVLFAIIGCWIVWVSVVANLAAAWLGKRSWHPRLGGHS
jgi:hypothetical protein